MNNIQDRELKTRFREAIIEIRKAPYVGSPKKGNLNYILGHDIYYRVTNYDEGVLIIIILAGTRENFYAELDKYIKGEKTFRNK